MSSSRSSSGSGTVPGDRPGGWSLVDDRGGGIDEHQARDAVKQALFGSVPNRVTIGRYALERQIGVGGLGVVFAARDPELDRLVAIKLLRARADSGAGRARTARLVREARTLARVSHPNVVAIYDVGTYAFDADWPLAEEAPNEGVYIVMEYIAGVELRTWMRDHERPWREVLATCIAAGRGLAAAHAVGLVHRDFKPANVLVGDDGRVRVLDFGLARAIGPDTPDEAVGAREDFGDATLTLSGVALGTPAYMAPEQHAQNRADERSDQFAFCVTVWEALYGERPFAGDTLMALIAAKSSGMLRTPPSRTPVPDAVRSVLERGLQEDPAARWAAMEALIAALERIVRPPGLRRFMAVAGVTIAAIAGAWLAAPTQGRCEDGAAAIDDLWNERSRHELRAAILGVDVVWAETTAGHVEAALDAFALRWRSSHADACDVAQSDPEFDARMTCLRDDLRRVRAFVDVLREADARVVERSVENAASLPDPERCAVQAAVAVPSDANSEAVRDALATADALLQAGRYDAAYDEALRAEALALRGARPGLRAEALVAVGKARSERGDWSGAEATLSEAYWLASEHGHDRAAAEAALMLVIAISEGSARYDEAERWGEHARSIFGRMDADPVALGRLDAALGSVAHRRGDYDRAIAHTRASVAVYEAAVAADDVRLSVVLGNLGGMLAMRGDWDEGEAVLRRALAIRERALGPDHPDVAQVSNTLAVCLAAQGKRAEALPLQRRAVTVWQRALGDDHPLVGMALNNLGTTAEALGDDALALDSHRRALEIREARVGGDHPDTGVSLLNLGIALDHLGRREEAQAVLERALGVLRTALGDDHDHVAYARTALGSVLRRRGELERARELLELAAASHERAPDRPYAMATHGELGATLVDMGRFADALPWLERVVASPGFATAEVLVRASNRFALARALWESGGDRDRARALVREAQRELANAELHGQIDTERRELLADLALWAETHAL